MGKPEVENVRSLDLAMWYDMGPTLTCREAAGLAALLRSLGLAEQGQALAESHESSEHDEDGCSTPPPPQTVP